MVISIGDLEKETEFGPHNIFFSGFFYVSELKSGRKLTILGASASVHSSIRMSASGMRLEGSVGMV